MTAALAQAGLADQAKDAALQAKDAVLRIEEPRERSEALASVAGAMACAHKFQLAREVAESCGRPESKLDAFTMILIEYMKMTKPELAKVLDKLASSRDE